MNTKIRKIIVAIAIVSLASIFIMNTSFAASKTEVIGYEQKTSGTVTDSFKTNSHVEVSTLEKFDYENIFGYMVKKFSTVKKYININIDKKYQKNYKIKSLKVSYSKNTDVHENETPITTTKVYSAKNKAKLSVKLLKDYNINNKVTVYYYYKNKLKKRSLNIANPTLRVEQTNSMGKKAKTQSTFKTDYSKKPKTYNPTLKISTSGKKIKSVKVSDESIVKSFSKNYKGNKKTSLTLKLPVTSYKDYITAKIKYY